METIGIAAIIIAMAGCILQYSLIRKWMSAAYTWEDNCKRQSDLLQLKEKEWQSRLQILSAAYKEKDRECERLRAEKSSLNARLDQVLRLTGETRMNISTFDKIEDSNPPNASRP